MLAFISIAAAGCGGTAETSQKDNSTVVEGEKVTLPEESPTLIGKVKEIVGNEVTIYIGQVAQNEGTPKENSNLTQTQNQNQDNKGGRPENAGFGMKFTEETETFLIPVGIPIVTMQSGSDPKQVELTKITEDSILRIWKEDGTISFVQVTGSKISKSTGQDEEKKGQGNFQDMGGPPPGM